MAAKRRIMVNRAPVLTLWASVVAERLGFDRDEALTLGKAVAGLTAQSKGRRLGIYKPGKAPGKRRARLPRGEQMWIELCGRAVPAVEADGGVRAVVRDKQVDPVKVEAYLAGKFGADLGAVREAMEDLAGALEPEQLADDAFRLYEQFRPDIPAGKRGWGAVGELDLDRIRGLS